MLTGLLLLALALPAAPAAASPVEARWRPDYRAGWAFHYHPYPDPAGRSMRQVAARRGLALDGSADGYASTPDCGRIGWFVRARVAGRLVRLQVVDCSAPRDRAAQARRGLVLEVDWSLAHAGGWATYGGATGPGRAPAVLLGWRPPH